MSLFDDILKGLPENDALRSIVGEAKAENASLKQEIASLKSEFRQLKAENVRLKKENERLKYPHNLDETSVEILTILANIKGKFGHPLDFLRYDGTGRLCKICSNKIAREYQRRKKARLRAERQATFLK